MSEIQVRREGESVAVVTINRPHRRNALDGNAWRDVGRAFSALHADSTVRAIVLTGAGGAFCAGDDILAFAEVRDNPAERAVYWDHIMAAYAAVSAARVPVVAAVSGPCVGGGCTLALRADFRVGDATARFAVPPAKLGLVYPADSTHLLVATAGIAVAKRMLYSAQFIDAQTALGCGLLSAVVDADPVAAALEFVAPMVRNAPISIEAAKLACNAALPGPSGPAADRVAELLRLADASEDCREGSRAFAEKRQPRFTGR